MYKKKNKHPEIPNRKNTLRTLPLLVALALAPAAPYAFAQTAVNSDFLASGSCSGGTCTLNTGAYTANGDTNSSNSNKDIPATTSDNFVVNGTTGGVSLTVTGYSSQNPPTTTPATQHALTTSGTITVENGASFKSYAGIKSGGTSAAGITHSGAGTFEAIGSAGGDGVTITVSGFTQAASAGTVIATGSGGKGMRVTGGFTAGSRVQATGASSGIGIDTDTYTQAGGALTATGNVGKGVVTSGTFSQTGGDVSAAGDSGGTGVQAASYQISAGSIVGSAGAAGSIGLDITGNFTHTAGYVEGTSRLNSSGGIGIQVGGNYTQAAGHIETTNIAGIGIKVGGNFTQNGGTIFADASENMAGVGIHIVGELSQGQNGTIMTMGGVGPNTYGTYVGKTATIDGTLISRRDENSSGIASMYVDNSGTATTALTFGATAVYQPEFTPAANAGGLVVAKGDIAITSGARIEPQLTNTIGLADGTSGSVTVLQADGGTINGTFANTAVDNGSLKYSAAKGVDSYTVDWSYTSPATVFESTPGVNAGPNTLALLQTFRSVNPATANVQTLAALNTMNNAIANTGSTEQMLQVANQVQLTSTPHATTRAAQAGMTQINTAMAPLNTGIKTLADAGVGFNGILVAAAPTVTKSDVAAFNPKLDKFFWLTPIYQTGTHHAKTNEFTKSKDYFAGIALGVAQSFGNTTLGGQLHYIYGKQKSAGDSPYYHSSTDTYGFTVSARQDRLLPTYDSGTNSTWAQAYVGYALEKINQTRADFIGERHDASPDANLWSAGLSIGRDVSVGRARLSPEVGFDYTHVKIDSYTEGNDNGYNLKVTAKDYDSMRLKLGGVAELPVYGNLNFRGAAYYRYEVMDNKMRMNTAFAGAPDTVFTTSGENISRSSGDISLGLRYYAKDDMSFGADYTVVIQDSYIGHQFGLNFVKKF